MGVGCRLEARGTPRFQGVMIVYSCVVAGLLVGGASVKRTEYTRVFCFVKISTYRRSLLFGLRSLVRRILDVFSRVNVKGAYPQTHDSLVRRKLGMFSWVKNVIGAYPQKPQNTWCDELLFGHNGRESRCFLPIHPPRVPPQDCFSFFC